MVRPWKNDKLQVLRIYGGRSANLRNEQNFCIDSPRSHENSKVQWWRCSRSNMNQGWSIAQINVRNKKRSVRRTRSRRGARRSRPAKRLPGRQYKYPIRDGLRFVVRTKKAAVRNLALSWNENVGHGQFRLGVKPFNAKDPRVFWVFDSRTRTMRCWSHRNFVVSG